MLTSLYVSLSAFLLLLVVILSLFTAHLQSTLLQNRKHIEVLQSRIAALEATNAETGLQLREQVALNALRLDVNTRKLDALLHRLKP